MWQTDLGKVVHKLGEEAALRFGERQNHVDHCRLRNEGHRNYLGLLVDRMRYIVIAVVLVVLCNE